tara:strand:- start:48864 stop:49754 length:891 start_codon:yes stop_codon:yes gene_type:complete
MIKVTVWGSRGSIPVSGSQFHRHGGSTTSIEIELLDSTEQTPSRVLIDCGTGLTELGKNWGDRVPEALMLQTHMHWDHIQGFPFFGPLFNPASQFELYAVPRDGQTFNEVLSQQMTKPTFPIGIDILPATLDFHSLPQNGQMQKGELTLSWVELWHPSGSTAFRIDYKGASFVFTGDVEVQQGCRSQLIEFAKDADVMIMDAQYFPEEYESRKGFGHSTPVDAVSVAKEAGIKHLYMTHHDPSHDDERLDEKLRFAQSLNNDGLLTIHNTYDGLQIDVRPSNAPRDADNSLISATA